MSSRQRLPDTPLGDVLTFRFDPPLRCGGPGQEGESSFFFGYAHILWHAEVDATIIEREGRQYPVTALGPG